MTTFMRSEHNRTNQNGTISRVKEHFVTRNVWEPKKPHLDLRQNDASRFLERYLVRSVSGCFVNPNARCPICSEPVFFYANHFGSKVYFDDIGHPWPKHPCTDNPRRKISDHAAPTGVPMQRNRGMIQELLEAANIIGRFHNKELGKRKPNDWSLLIITSVERDGEKNIVRAEHLDAKESEEKKFECFSSQSIFDVGDFINIRGVEVSFLYKETLTPAAFTIGGRVSFPEKRKEPNDQSTRQSYQLIKKQPSQSIKTKTHHRLKKQKKSSTQKSIKDDKKHFQLDAMSINEFCDQFVKIVRTFAQEGTRKPHDVALRLNHDGYRTACGSEWTPRLAHLLLNQIFNSKNKTKQPEETNKQEERKARTSRKHNPLNKHQPLTKEELAKRQAAYEYAMGIQPQLKNEI